MSEEWIAAGEVTGHETNGFHGEAIAIQGGGDQGRLGNNVIAVLGVRGFDIRSRIDERGGVAGAEAEAEEEEEEEEGERRSKDHQRAYLEDPECPSTRLVQWSRRR